ncbi:TIGR02206 family membrane protein [Salisediminibacterium halotolerans]|uniref:YwaF family protein n=1 Tax=Salisediminibacterium halotolerans TaxID=517425 RepID=UPI000EB3368E|nr:TIGR02206 family membrane protein [Salisediminibacterium halotolerans]RLJ71732.1 putative integral membrane protein (TIGR02206 family) [Actinophytocola xinjiangensis]RPE86882.1 putative integral membrane protein (TIGR02206 family) [Salisediminibacterium halotolerans]TWG32945.1 putative integral membrane protein (TIGR02206 family) [Salisediminibacterium halotolerans]GEL08211.1 ABC transporter permease [Salisediminibacterium halotolerans]
MWFAGDNSEVPFTTLGAEHNIMIVVFVFGCTVVYLTRGLIAPRLQRPIEVGIAVSLILFESGYHIWAVFHGNWDVRFSLPLELSSSSVILTIVLLLYRNEKLFQIVFLIAIGGAIQAIVTPVLGYGFPHFRYWHFFYTHIAVIWVVFYFLWHRAYPLPFISVIKAMIFLNILLPFIYGVNLLTGGNYWFIMEKPAGGSLLDILGPHPWYILGMEGAAVVLFTLLWLLFGTRRFK